MAIQSETTEEATFYSPWPLFGRRFSSQLDEVRQNFEALHPIVRAAGLDDSSLPLKNNAVAAFEIGEFGFHNKYRVFWDKDNDTFRIQQNIGTSGVPSWEDRLTVGPSGELVGNFYIDVNVSAADTTTASNLGGGAFIFAQEVGDDLQFRSLVAGAGISIFPAATELTISATGSATGDPGFYGINVKQTDNLARFKGINTLNFEASSFYVEQNAPNTDEVIISFRGTAGSGGSGVTDHGNLTGLLDDDHPQYLLRSDVGGFYGITVKQTNGLARFRNIQVINFGPEFYIGQNFPNTDEVIINLRDDFDDIAGAGAGEANTASNLGLPTSIGIFAQKVGVDLQFKSLVSGTGIEISANSTEITLTGSPGFYGITVAQTNGLANFRGLNKINFGPEFYISQNFPNTDEVIVNLRDDFDNGEANTASNLPGGEGIFAQKVGVDLQFKSLAQGTNILITSDANTVTINSTASGGGGGGFYGIVVKQQNELESFNNIVVLNFSNDFYISQNVPNTDEALISLRQQPIRKVTGNFLSSFEWIFNHGLNTQDIGWWTYDGRQRAIFPEQADVSDPNTAYFYFIQAQAGRVVLVG